MTMTSRQKMIRAAFTAELIDGARASNQTVFENSDRLADDDGVVFVTAVPDAPLQVSGRLGRDGRWYIGIFFVAPLDHPAALAEGDMLCSVVLRSEPVAEAMIRFGVAKMTDATLAGKSAVNGADAFLARLALPGSVRFRRVEEPSRGAS